VSLDLKLYGSWFLDRLFDLQVIESNGTASIYMELWPDNDPQADTMRRYHKMQDRGLRLLAGTRGLRLKNIWADPDYLAESLGLTKESVAAILLELARHSWICSPYLPYPFAVGLGGSALPRPLPIPAPGRPRYVLITAPGAMKVIGDRAAWEDAVLPETPLAERILRWMYDRAPVGESSDLSNFLVSPHATIHGRWQYRLDQLIAAARHLRDSELIVADDAQFSEGDLTACLSAGGQRCITVYGGDIPVYLREETGGDVTSTGPSTPPAVPTAAIFIVHGSDTMRAESIARTVERATGRETIILREQPSLGQTLIEKFENNAAQASYAIIVLTPDDQGSRKGETTLNPRARQNVIFEMGYFYGRIGRRNVAVLIDPAVEKPSDTHGIAYITLDDIGAWKGELFRELRHADINVRS
jgi:Predicted nucleotide-binding protein containing TIR-like domain